MAKGYKTGGRSSGTPNKTTEELRNTVQSFIEKNIESMQANFDQLEAKDKLLFIEKMLNYTLPRLKQVELDADIKDSREPLQIVTTLTVEELKAALAK